MPVALPSLALHESTNPEEIDAASIATQWIGSFSKAVDGSDWTTLLKLVDDQVWWRDILAFDWDWSSKSGPDEIRQSLSSSKHGFRGISSIASGGLAPMFMNMGGAFIQAGLRFQNNFGSGRGFIRLVNTGPSEWKAWTIFTWLEELTPIKPQPNGAPKDKTDFQVMVVGAGQAGLALAAHLQAMGLTYRVIDGNPKVGNSWRKRYDILQSHTPSYGDHYPHLKYPDTYPKWATRDDMADWQEHYAKTLNLNVSTNTLLEKADYNPQTKTYHVHLKDTTGTHTRTTSHLVLATGFFPSTPRLPSLTNTHLFPGTIYHTSTHTTATSIPSLPTQRIAIIGTGTSAHDIAQDFVTHSARAVTLIQRSPLYTMSRTAIEATIMAPYRTPGVTLDEADVMGNSFPIPVLLTLATGMQLAMSAIDREILDRMEEKGLWVKRGGDGGSALDQILRKLGGAYIDQGAQEMIADGRIGVVGCEEGVEGFYEGGVVLGNGRRVEADVVVLATGYKLASDSVSTLLGPEVKERVGDIGEMDERGERIGWWRPTGMPGFWFMTGNFMWARQFSKVLALQIKAIEDGLNPEYYDEPTSTTNA